MTTVPNNQRNNLLNAFNVNTKNTSASQQNAALTTDINAEAGNKGKAAQKPITTSTIQSALNNLDQGTQTKAKVDKENALKALNMPKAATMQSNQAGQLTLSTQA